MWHLDLQIDLVSLFCHLLSVFMCWKMSIYESIYLYKHTFIHTEIQTCIDFLHIFPIMLYHVKASKQIDEKNQYHVLLNPFHSTIVPLQWLIYSSFTLSSCFNARLFLFFRLIQVLIFCISLSYYHFLLLFQVAAQWHTYKFFLFGAFSSNLHETYIYKVTF